MKTGKSLTELAMEIERQMDAKKDFIAPTAKLTAHAAHGAVKLQIGADPAMVFPVNQLALRQIGEHTGIPAKYVDVMVREAPELLAVNINHWFHSKPAKRTVRTLDGNVRAVLSEKFRTLDNADLAQAAFPAIQQLGVDVLSMELTERRLYIKCVDKKANARIKLATGHAMGEGHARFDDLCPAIVISNSEVGEGRLGIEAGIFTTGCTNMMISKQRSMSKYHVGRGAELGDSVYELLSDATKDKTDAATWAQVGDVIRGAFDKVRFDAEIAKLQGTTEDAIEADVVEVVNMAAKRFTLSDGVRSSVLTHLIKGGDLSRYGLINAITRTAEDQADYDDATDLERLGGTIVELGKNEWREIANAA